MKHKIHFRGAHRWHRTSGMYFGTVETDDVITTLAEAERMMVLGKFWSAGGESERADGTRHYSHTQEVLGPRKH